MIKSIFRILVILLILGIVFFMLTTGHVISEERETGLKMLVCSAQLRQNVEEHLLKGHVMLKTMSNPCPKVISTLDIDKSGLISLKNYKYKIELSLIPMMVDSKVNWSCKGSPKEYVPLRCRNNTQQGN